MDQDKRESLLFEKLLLFFLGKYTKYFYWQFTSTLQLNFYFQKCSFSLSAKLSDQRIVFRRNG